MRGVVLLNELFLEILLQQNVHGNHQESCIQRACSVNPKHNLRKLPFLHVPII